MGDQANGLMSNWLRSKRILAVRPYLRGKILDYGCGIGSLAEICSPDAYCGIESDLESLSIAQSRYPAFRFEQTIPRENYFDTIVLLAVIEHLNNPECIFETLKLFLSKNGQIILTTPHPAFNNLYIAGAKLGLFSKIACSEHNDLLSYQSIIELSIKCGLEISFYKRFLYGANQLAILSIK